MTDTSKRAPRGQMRRKRNNKHSRQRHLRRVENGRDAMMTRTSEPQQQQQNINTSTINKMKEEDEKGEKKSSKYTRRKTQKFRL